MTPQVTSPLRESSDINDAINMAYKNCFDSIFSATVIEDFCLWEKTDDKLYSITYDHKTRKPRQLIKKTFLENGSFYIFRPDILKEENNRLGGKIGYYLLEKFKSFQIDSSEDLRIAKSIMKEFDLVR